MIIKANIDAFVQYINHADRVTFLNGCEVEFIDLDAVDYDIAAPRLTFRYKGENDETDLDLDAMESAEFNADAYHFHIVMKDGTGYEFEVYQLTRVDFPEVDHA